ncbi:hypothetical protein J6590_027742 [Homalodisca vitripennis]|nr:hypothetical protein J6590_027742 [Homalodisca vitripennis]
MFAIQHVLGWRQDMKMQGEAVRESNYMFAIQHVLGRWWRQDAEMRGSARGGWSEDVGTTVVGPALPTLIDHDYFELDFLI